MAPLFLMLIQFVEILLGGERSTQEFRVKSGNQQLGYVRWHGTRRQYCFFMSSGWILDWKLLRRIADFCEKKTRQYKSLTVREREVQREKIHSDCAVRDIRY